MRSNNSNGSRAAPARGFMALFAIMLTMGLALAASRAEAAPFAYVTNNGSNTVSVIDTAANPPSVVATIPVAGGAFAVAVAPDGKHAYVTGVVVSVIDTLTNTVVATVPVSGASIAVTPDGKRVYVAEGAVSVIDTATNTVVATNPVAMIFGGIVIAPDGKHAYGTRDLAFNKGEVRVLDTATNKVVAIVQTGSTRGGIAVSPDGKRVYVPNDNFVVGSSSIAVVDTATNMVVSAFGVPPKTVVFAIAITPDGKHAYVTGNNDVTGGVVLVIDTASTAVVATVPVPVGGGIAVTPDGKHAYVANQGSTVSVIDTASNTVVATVGVGNTPEGVGIVPPPPGVPFIAFNAKLEIDLDSAPNEDSFELHSSFTLSSTAPAIDPVAQPVTLQIGTFTITIPPGSFRKHKNGSFTVMGSMGSVTGKALIKPTGTLRYAFNAEADDASLTGTKNPVYVTLIIGGVSGATSVQARISP